MSANIVSSDGADVGLADTKTRKSCEWLRQQCPGNEFSDIFESVDWDNTELGDPSAWPNCLRTAVGLIMSSAIPCTLVLGREKRTIYNPGYTEYMGSRHPWAFGQTMPKVWPEAYHTLGPHLEYVYSTGKTLHQENDPFQVPRHGMLDPTDPGFFEDIYATYSYSPIRNDQGVIFGILCIMHDTTKAVVAERRLEALRELAARTNECNTIKDTVRSFEEVFSRHNHDATFAMLYEVDRDVGVAKLIAQAATHPTHKPPTDMPSMIKIKPWALQGTAEMTTTELADLHQTDDDDYEFSRAIATGKKQPVHRPSFHKTAPNGDLVPDTRHNPTLMTYPLVTVTPPPEMPGTMVPDMIAVFGVNRRKKLDSLYTNFYDLAASQMETATNTSRAFENQKRMADDLLELDKAKMVFFSNVSHEFRTPLSLILGPIEEILTRRDELPEKTAETLDIVRRSANRLLKLVNTLLQLARASHMKPNFKATNIAAFTRDMAGHFATAAQQFNLKFIIESSGWNDKELVYIDRDMYERVVLNLLSNAFKFTVEGGVTVKLFSEESIDEQTEVNCAASNKELVAHRWCVLQIIDTGIGIPDSEQTKIWDRFYTVPSSKRVRSKEGIGIGLNLVEDIVRAHGGTIDLQSQPGSGSCFTVRLPTGMQHLPEQIATSAITEIDQETVDVEEVEMKVAPNEVEQFLDEMKEWAGADTDIGNNDDDDDEHTQDSGVSSPVDEGGNSSPMERAGMHPLSPHLTSLLPAGSNRHTVLLVDDNADMRRFIKKILVAADFRVETAANGEEALKLAISLKNLHVILTDIMMPVMDGLSLTRALRKNPKTQLVPIVLLTARVGANENVDGFGAGADDYLTKPFMARELITRISVHCNLHNMRLGVIRTREEVQVLEAANETKAKLLALVSHELRTPLSSIIGGVELIQLTNLTHEQRSHLTTIEYSAQMLLAIIQDILDIGKLETTDTFAFEISEFDPRQVLEKATDTLADRASTKHLEFVCFINRHVPDRLSADPTRIKQVITNLVDNAVKFTERGMVEVRMCLDAPPMENGRQGPANGPDLRMLRVEVVDTGIGMRSTEHIFEPFWQAEKGSTRRYGGSGLGLTVSKQLVEKAGGRIGVNSEYGKGTTFWFTWPVDVRAGSTSKRRPSATDSTALSTATQAIASVNVYMVITHRVTARAISEALASAGATKVFNVESPDQLAAPGHTSSCSDSTSTRKDLKELEVDEQSPNVVIVDHKLISSDLWTRTLKQVQNIDPDVFLIYLVDRTLGKKKFLAIDGTLTKPVHRAHLVELMLKAAEQKKRRPNNSRGQAIRKLRSTSITIIPSTAFSLTLPKTPSEMLSTYFKKGPKTPMTPESSTVSGGSYFTHHIDNSSKSSVASSSKRSSITLTRIDASPQSPPFDDMASTPSTPFTLTSSPSKSRMKQVRILVAEDNQINQSLMIKQLQKIGYGQVDAANNGAEVLQMIEPQMKEMKGEKDIPGYTLILMDCDMPVMDGFEATTKIRELNHPVCTIPVIAVTANAYVSDRQRCIDAGMSDYLSKPATLEQLRTVIARWIGS